MKIIVVSLLVIIILFILLFVICACKLASIVDEDSKSQ